jgi:hypothetical protein
MRARWSFGLSHMISFRLSENPSNPEGANPRNPQTTPQYNLMPGVELLSGSRLKVQKIWKAFPVPLRQKGTTVRS